MRVRKLPGGDGTPTRWSVVLTSGTGFGEDVGDTVLSATFWALHQWARDGGGIHDVEAVATALAADIK